MAVLTNYTIQCTDQNTGKVGDFLFDVERWKQTGLFFAVSPVYRDLDEFYKNTKPEDRRACYEEMYSDNLKEIKERGKR